MNFETNIIISAGVIILLLFIWIFWLEIKKIILAGELSVPEELVGYLGKHLKLEVSLPNVWINIFSFDEHIPEINFSDSIPYATAIGLALRVLEK